MDFSRRCLRAPVVLVGAALAIAYVACSRRRRQVAKAPALTPARRLTSPRARVQIEAAGTPGTLSDADRNAIIETLRKYVAAATIDPLHGKPVGDLSTVFTPEATRRLNGADRSAAVDETCRGRATGAVTPGPTSAARHS